MCSISGFSFSPKSRFDAKALAKALLIAGELRGKHATGYAYMADNGQIYGRSDDKRALAFTNSQMFALPRDAKSVILHTRFATQGLATNFLNNHPVYAYAGTDTVAAVHNGCIWNDYTLFRTEGLKRYGQVDSEIIPAMLAAKGSDAYADVFNQIEGSVASAWLDERTGSTLHLVRATDSPVHIAHVDEPKRISRRGNRRPRLLGVVFASTAYMLERGLNTLGLSLSGRYTKHFVLAEGQYLSVTDGVWDGLVRPFDIPEGRTYEAWDYPATSLGARSRANKRWYAEDDDDNLSWPQWRAKYDADTGYGTGKVSTSSTVIGYPSEGYNAGSGQSFVAGPNGTLDRFQADMEEADETTFEVIEENGDRRHVTMGEILNAQANGDITDAEAEQYMHLEYCENDFCVLNDEDHCPVFQGITDASTADKQDRSGMTMTDEEISIVSLRMLQRSGIE